MQLSCLCYEYSSDILSLLATGGFDLQRTSTNEVVIHYTPDILEYVSYKWFQWCRYFDKFTKSKRLCCCLGPSHQVGKAFCSNIILDNYQHIVRSSFVGKPQDEFLSDNMKEETKKFMTSLDSLILNYREGVFHPTSHISFTIMVLGRVLIPIRMFYLMVMNWTMLNPKLLTKLI